MYRWLPLLSLVLALACGEHPTTGPHGVPDLTGPWDWTSVRTYAGASSGTVCHDTGSFTFTKLPAAYTGSARSVQSCSTAGSVVSYLAADSLFAISLSASTLTFSRGFSSGLCRDTATMAAGASSAADEISGVATCQGSTEQWHAVRGAAVTSVAVSPEQLPTVRGASSRLTAVLRASSGERVFRGSVTWSSDAPGVIAVDSAGGITASAIGQAHVTATVDGRSAVATVTVLPPTSLSAVSAGDARTCALGADGLVYCWGHETELFDVTSSPFVPIPLPAPERFAALSNGYRFGCALTSAGAAYCFGEDTAGQLGIGVRLGHSMPTAVAGGLRFTAISAGANHACGLASGGAAWCWGDGSSGQLGNGTTATSLTPAAVGGGKVFASLSAGRDHTCGVSTAGALLCWGNNDAGQLGDGSTTSRSLPADVSNGLTWSRVSAGSGYTCALTTGGVAYCWGDAYAGKLGTGDRVNQPTPHPVVGGHAFTTIAAGAIHTCALDAAGAAWCWGANYFGQLGDGFFYASGPAPVRVTGGLSFSSITVGLYEYSDETHNGGTSSHTCAVTPDGVVYCWGDDLIGQLGNGSRLEGSNAPLKVAGQR